MQLTDWTEDDKRLDGDGNVVAEIVPNPNPFTKLGQEYIVLWRTPQTEDAERSIYSGMAMADRQLRIDGYLPELERKTFTIPNCGHTLCAHGFMGCIVEANGGVTITDEMAGYAEVGSKVVLRKVLDTGFPAKDWVKVGP